MNTPFAMAAVLSGITCLVHVVLGGRECVEPLLDSSVPWVAKMTHYYCWHLVSLTLALMSGGYAYAASVPDGWDVGVAVTLLSTSFMAWSIGLGLWKRPKPWYALPQWVLFLAISAAGLAGVF